MRADVRGKPRPGRRVAVRYRAPDEPSEQGAFTKNIGVGGAFILTTDPPPPGTRLQIVLEIPHKDGPVHVEVTGEVRWIVDGKHDEPEREHGMGVKFSGLDVDQLLALNEYFASLPSTVNHG